MSKKYRKKAQKSKRVMRYVTIAVLVIVFNMINLIDTFRTNPNTSLTLQTVAPIAAFFVNCLSLLYCIIQDIIQSVQEPQAQFILEQKNDIPFVDREELLSDVLSGISTKITEHGYYYTKNIRYGVHNGKRSFAQKLCWELQRIKTAKPHGLHGFDAKIASKIGNIFLVDYAHYSESFELHIKTEFAYIRGKINIVVVINSCDDLLLWTDALKDKDVFFVFLNFNTNSEDALFFADDKIVELLHRLQTIPAYSSICAGKTEEEICAMAAKLGGISHNNIGTIIDLLSSDEFSLLLETDELFVDFYVALKHGRYQEAEELYHGLPVPSHTNRVLQYKLKYEAANLAHFLGKYDEANQSLDLLTAEMFTDTSFISSSFGEGLYFDTTLLQSHILKHQGKFNDAAEMLNRIGDRQRNSVWLRAHFAINIFQLNELILPTQEWDTILNALAQKMEIFQEQRKLINSEYFFYEAYYPIVSFYTNRFDCSIIPNLIKMEDCAIDYYEVNERRYVTNCYYIKAELLRINQQWKEAEEYYNRCYNIYCHNGDKDILYLVAIACKCLCQFEGIILNVPFDWEKAISECKQQEGYGFHQRLISKMELASTNQDLRKYWLSRYRVTINPIP